MLEANSETSGRLTRLLLTVGALCLSLGLAVPAAEAGKSGKDLNHVLGEIEWGDSKDQVLKKLKAKMLKKLRQRKDLRHDRVKMQRAHRRLNDEFEEIKASYQELEGKKTGYEVSVIADEYTKNNSESLLKINDNVAQRFFFFIDGSFYKMVVAYKQHYLENVGFKAFIGQVSKKYGKPDETDYAEIGGEETLALAKWKDGRTILRVKNEQEFFGTYAMAFSDRKLVERMSKKGEAFGGSDKNKEDGGVSSRVESLKSDTAEDESEDVVNGMLGESVEVDLGTKEDKLEDQGPTGKSKEKREEEKQEEVAEKESDSSGSSGGGSSSSSEEEEDKDRDFSNISTDSEEKEEDDELIIY